MATTEEQLQCLRRFQGDFELFVEQGGYAGRASQPAVTRKTKRVRPTTIPSSKPPRKHKKREAFGQDANRIHEVMHGGCGCGLYDEGCFLEQLHKISATVSIRSPLSSERNGMQDHRRKKVLSTCTLPKNTR
jgi:hypothetical protein